MQAAAYEVRIRQLEQHMARSLSGRSGAYFSGATSRDIASTSGLVSGQDTALQDCNVEVVLQTLQMVSHAMVVLPCSSKAV